MLLTAQEIENIFQTKAKPKECLACEKIRLEKEAQAARKKDALRKKLGIQFYDWDSKVPETLQCSKTKPEELAGEYDILFNYVFNVGEIENSRTTQGTVVLQEGTRKKDEEKRENNESEKDNEKAGNDLVVSGTVEYLPAMRIEKSYLCQHDFTLSEGTHGTDCDGSNWECELKARPIDAEAIDVVHDTCDMEFADFLPAVY